MDKIGITTGDPNGIGAEITIKALQKLNLPQDKIVLISNKKILDYYGKLDKNYEIIEIPYSSEIQAGTVTKEAGEFSYQSLKRICELRPKAIVTAPVAKNALHLAGHIYNGQTEVLQKFLAHDNQLAEMLFVTNNFRVLLLTRHCALKDITLTKKIVITENTYSIHHFAGTWQPGWKKTLLYLWVPFSIKFPRLAAWLKQKISN